MLHYLITSSEVQDTVPDLSGCGAGGAQVAWVPATRQPLPHCTRIVRCDAPELEVLPSRRLSDDEVRQVRLLCACGVSDRHAAVKYGISESLVYQLRLHHQRAAAGGPRTMRQRAPHGKARRRWTDEDIDRMGRLRLEGRTWAEIGDEYGLSSRGAQNAWSRRRNAGPSRGDSTRR